MKAYLISNESEGIVVAVVVTNGSEAQALALYEAQVKDSDPEEVTVSERILII